MLCYLTRKETNGNPSGVQQPYGIFTKWLTSIPSKSLGQAQQFCGPSTSAGGSIARRQGHPLIHLMLQIGAAQTKPCPGSTNESNMVYSIKPTMVSHQNWYYQKSLATWTTRSLLHQRHPRPGGHHGHQQPQRAGCNWSRSTAPPFRNTITNLVCQDISHILDILEDFGFPSCWDGSKDGSMDL